MDKARIWGVLLSLVVKRLAAQAAALKGEHLPSMIIWLQSQHIEEAASKVYKSLGLLKVNGDIKQDNGKSFMPPCLSDKSCPFTFIDVKKCAMNLLLLRCSANTSDKEVQSTTSPKLMIEEKVADHFKKWVVDDYIIVPPDIQWKRLPNIMEQIKVMSKKTRKYEFKEVAQQFLNKDDKKYQTMIKMVLDSREKFDDDNLTQLFYGTEGQHTCRWCHEHWMGSGGYISLPSSKENFLK